jgi:hypothetical protein
VTTLQIEKPAAAAGLRGSWLPLLILTALLAIGAFLRFDQITRQDLWRDEYWTLCLATGRGQMLVLQPRNQVIDPPPAAGFVGAPPWWHIWNSIQTTSHPPLYHIILRFWVDALGDSDLSVRGMSAFFSLGCIVLLYLAVKASDGKSWQAMTAAAIMALAPVQIYYSQQVRPYTMLEFIALAAAIVLMRIEKRGISVLTLVMLGVATAAMALTHYFSAGLIAAMAVYALIRLRGKARIAAVSAIFIGGIVAAVVWAPHLGDYSLVDYGRIPGRNILHLLLSVPQRLTLNSNLDPLLMADSGSWPVVIALALLVYLLPLYLMRRQRWLLFWWLSASASALLIFVIDVARHSTLLTFTRYVIPAAPGVYAILAGRLPGRLGKLIPWIILLGVGVYGADYYSAGPPCSPDLKIITRMVRSEVSPDDVVIVTGSYYFAGNDEPVMTYFAIAHYGGPWKVPVLFGTAAISPQVQAKLLQFHKIWVLGVSPDSDTAKILPGWTVRGVHGPGFSSLLWYVTPKSQVKS